MTQQAEQAGLNSDRTALPLGEAAERLGLSSEALRMRWKRGKVDGFRRGGRVFIYLGERLNSRPNKPEQVSERTTEQTEQPEQRANADHGVIIEFQKTELTRLLRENERLNERIDSLIKLQEREQVLRQQMQGQLDQLMERLALPAPSPPPPTPAPAPEQDELKERLQATETKFNVLTRAVGQLVAFLERRRG